MDLPIEMRQAIESVQNTISKYSDDKIYVQNRSFEQVDQVAAPIRQLEEKIAATEAVCSQNNAKMVASKRAMHQYWKYGESIVRSITTSRTVTTTGSEPEKHQYAVSFGPQDYNFLEEIVSSMERRVSEIRTVSETLENYRSDSKSYAGTLKNCMKYQHEAFIGLTAKYAEAQQEVERSREAYRAFIKRSRNDYRDPFRHKSRPAIDLAPTSSDYLQQAARPDSNVNAAASTLPGASAGA